jgi:hypothetical protein
LFTDAASAVFPESGETTVSQYGFEIEPEIVKFERLGQPMLDKSE